MINSKTSSLKEMNKSKRYVLGLQHLIAMFGATVLVPIITGFSPTVALLSAGIGTLIFHFCTGGKVPVFLGSSFAFIPVILQVKEMFGGDLAYAQGGIFVAGLIYVAFSFFVDKIGVEKIDKYLGPEIIGPMIIVIGLNLIPTAFSMASGNFIIAGLTLLTCLAIQIFAKGFIAQLSILIAVVIGYVAALITNQVDVSTIVAAKLFQLPAITFPKFNAVAIFTICPIVLAVFMEHVGDIKTNSQVVGEDFVKDPGLHRTLLGDGLATMFAALIGGPANTTYGENTAVLAITKNYDPSLIRLAAIYAIILSFLGKLGAIMQSIPAFVMGGISLFLFTMIANVGLRTIRNYREKYRPGQVVAMIAILVLGLGGGFLEKTLGITLAIPINNSVAISGLSFAAIVGIILNGIFKLIDRGTSTN